MSKAALLYFIFFIFSVGVRSETILSVEFSGDLPAGVEAKPPAAADAISIVANGGRDGSGAAQIKVMNSSAYLSDGGKIRAEYNTLAQRMTAYKEGDERTYKFSFKLDSGWVFDSRDSADIVWQFKRTESQPDMFVAVKGHDLVLRIGESRQMLLAGSLRTGVWADVKLHIHFSKTDKGSVEGGFKYASESDFENSEDAGANLRESEGETYLKWGIYKPDNFTGSNLTKTQSHILMMDAIEVSKP